MADKDSNKKPSSSQIVSAELSGAPGLKGISGDRAKSIILAIFVFLAIAFFVVPFLGSLIATSNPFSDITSALIGISLAILIIYVGGLR